MPVEKEQKETKALNIHQRLLKIVDAAGVFMRSKQAYGYKYTPENEIQAKVTGSSNELNVLLTAELVPGSMKVVPISYIKTKVKLSKDGKTVLEEPVDIKYHEVIVYVDVVYTWYCVDNPKDYIKVPWAYVGQMPDAAQAFGAGATYGNRYFLMKSLQLATTEDDPDNYRSKQQEAADYDNMKAEKKLLETSIEDIVTLGKLLTSQGLSTKAELGEIIKKYNNGNQNANSIPDIALSSAIMREFEKILEDANAKAAQGNKEDK